LLAGEHRGIPCANGELLTAFEFIFAFAKTRIKSSGIGMVWLFELSV
jgi:hypothetical protein